MYPGGFLIWLREGDAPMKFFHAHANARRRKNHIRELQHDGHSCTFEVEKAQIALSYFDGLMGTPSGRSNSINLD
jgi:hypothetical protein